MKNNQNHNFSRQGFLSRQIFQALNMLEIQARHFVEEYAGCVGRGCLRPFKTSGVTGPHKYVKRPSSIEFEKGARRNSSV